MSDAHRYNIYYGPSSVIPRAVVIQRHKVRDIHGHGIVKAGRAMKHASA